MILRLQTESILGVSLKNCDDEFLFNVNDQIFLTNRITADILSPEIRQLHFIDPTFNEYVIKTNNKGNFQLFLDLASFNLVKIPESDISFIEEIVLFVKNDFILFSKEFYEEITEDNVLELIKLHEKCPTLFNYQLKKEINYAASKFSIINEFYPDKIQELSKDSIEQILRNSNLIVDSEDQIITLVNNLYEKDHSYIQFYEYVLFSNLSTNKIKQFLELFDFNDLTGGIWNGLVERMCQSSDTNGLQQHRGRNLHKDNQYAYENESSYWQTIGVPPPPPLPPFPPPPPPPPSPPPPPPPPPNF